MLHFSRGGRSRRQCQEHITEKTVSMSLEISGIAHRAHNDGETRYVKA